MFTSAVRVVGLLTALAPAHAGGDCGLTDPGVGYPKASTNDPVFKQCFDAKKVVDAPWNVPRKLDITTEIPFVIHCYGFHGCCGNTAHNAYVEDVLKRQKLISAGLTGHALSQYSKIPDCNNATYDPSNVTLAEERKAVVAAAAAKVVADLAAAAAKLVSNRADYEAVLAAKAKALCPQGGCKFMATGSMTIDMKAGKTLAKKYKYFLSAMKAAGCSAYDCGHLNAKGEGHCGNCGGVCGLASHSGGGGCGTGKAGSVGGFYGSVTTGTVLCGVNDKCSKAMTFEITKTTIKGQQTTVDYKYTSINGKELARVYGEMTSWAANDTMSDNGYGTTSTVILRKALSENPTAIANFGTRNYNKLVVSEPTFGLYMAPTKSPVRKRETAAEIKARLCSTGKPIVHYAGTKYEKDVTATYCGTGSGAAATTPTKAPTPTPKVTVTTTVVMTGAVSKKDFAAALATKLGISVTDVEVVATQKSEFKMSATGTLADYTGSSAQALATQWAFKKATADAAGVTEAEVTVVYTAQRRRRLSGGPARQLRRATVDAAVTITSSKDISAALTPATLQTAFATKHAAAVQNLPAAYSAVTVAPVPSVTSTTPAYETTIVTSVKTTDAAKVSGQIAGPAFVKDALSAKNVVGVTVTSTSAPKTMAAPGATPVAAAAPEAESGNAAVIIVIVVLVLAIGGGVAYYLVNRRSKVTATPKDREALAACASEAQQALDAIAKREADREAVVP